MKFLTKESSPYNPKQEQQVGVSHRMSEGESSAELNAFLGKGCEYEGKLTFEGTVRIDGRFTGEVFSNDCLVIGEGAEVHAEIDVAVVAVSGSVRGNITAKNRVELHAPARLVGNIVTPALIIQEGVFFEGSCRMDVASYQKSQDGGNETVSSASSDEADMDTFDLSKYDSQG